MPKTRGVKKQPDNLIKCPATGSKHALESKSASELESESYSEAGIDGMPSHSALFASVVQRKRLQLD